MSIRATARAMITTPLASLSDDPVLRDFLRGTGWEGASIVPMGSDASPRRYARLTRADGRSAVLMVAPPDDHPKSLPGHTIREFAHAARLLTEAGFSVPQIYAASPELGLMLLEDFGDLTFRRALARGDDPAPLYRLATETLVRLAQDAPSCAGLPRYEDSPIYAGRRQIAEWYVPAVTGRAADAEMLAGFDAAWAEIESALPPAPRGFLHVDFHPDNLMLITGPDGAPRCGLLDFQTALEGPHPYDLANLLEDARAMVASPLKQDLQALYRDSFPTEQRAAIDLWFRVLAAQFHCRVVGLFVKLAVRVDKPHYLDFLPTTRAHLEAGLSDPVMDPLRRWMQENRIPTGGDAVLPSVAEIKPLIAPELF